ncbi:703a844b-1041-4189-9ec3-8a196d566704 [Thermothielavioides terrestris]|uniref:703a844b-1041-4189-9ec3-8a196d566704 n=1 Tax=Thermothielavioides terrestris TaxID=2587410 RepID=A0A446BCM2_9PEZI|nr:703a844b-1041-4189-9ec3-8a196d566704 [Thermothielavioides terrestris]
MSPKHPEALGGPGGYSVVYKGAESKEDHWIWQAWSVDETFNSHWAELMAIAEALNMAILRLSLKPTTRTAEIYLFTDSLRSLDFLMKKSSEAAKQSRRTTFFEHAGRPVRSFIARISRELHNLGVKLTLSHIPGHKHGVTGHIIADRTAHNVMVDRMEALQAPSKDQAPDSAVPNSLPSDLSLPKRRYIDDKVATRSSQHNPICF